MIGISKQQFIYTLEAVEPEEGRNQGSWEQ